METCKKPADRFDPSSPMGTRKWWDYQLAHCWERHGGPAQTTYFINELINHLPLPEQAYLRTHSLRILDWGCAMGEGVATLARAFPLCQVTGLDIAQSAIEIAQARYSQQEFILSEEGEIPQPFDVVLTSNVLEHFEDPLAVACRHAARSRLLYLILVPFGERPLMDGHLVTFTEDAFPLFLGGLVRLSAIPFETNPTYWYGRQILVVYASQAYIQTRPHETAPEWGLYFQAPPPMRVLLETLAVRGARAETALQGTGRARPEGMEARAEVAPNQVDEPALPEIAQAPPEGVEMRAEVAPSGLDKLNKLKQLRDRWAPCGSWRRKLLNRLMAGLLSRV